MPGLQDLAKIALPIAGFTWGSPIFGAGTAGQLMGAMTGSSIASLFGGGEAVGASAKQAANARIQDYWANSTLMDKANAQAVFNADQAMEHTQELNKEQYARSVEAADVAWGRSKEAATTAYERDIALWKMAMEEYNRRFQTTAKDLKAAGLNPILAAGGGYNVGNVPSTPSAPMGTSAMAVTPSSSAPMAGTHMAQVAPYQNIAESALAYQNISRSGMETSKLFTELVLNAKNMEKLGAEINKVNSETSRNLQDIDESFSRILRNRSEASLAQQQEHTDVQRLRNIAEQTKLISADVFKRTAEIKLLTAETGKMNAETDQARANIDQIVAKTKEIDQTTGLLKQELENAQAIGERLKATAAAYSGPVGEVLGYISAILGSLNISGSIGLRR